jgi:hypothetical protein
MRFTRRHAVLFWAIAVWNVFTYANFAKNLWQAHSSGEVRPAGYYAAHIVLIVVNVVIAVVLAWLGTRAWRAAGAPPAAAQESSSPDPAARR